METTIKQSLLAGILVGIGVVANATSPNKYMGAFLFSVALLAIVRCEMQLYTGKIGYYKQYKKLSLGVMLLFNIIGSAIPTILIAICREDLYKLFLHISEVKFANPIWVLLIYGFMCGILMLVAVHSKNEFIIILCIMVFILSGYEHCIADSIYIIVNFSGMNFLKFLSVVIGNTFGAILARQLMVNE